MRLHPVPQSTEESRRLYMVRADRSELNSFEALRLPRRTVGGPSTRYLPEQVPPAGSGLLFPNSVHRESRLPDQRWSRRVPSSRPRQASVRVLERGRRAVHREAVSFGTPTFMFN